MNEDKVKLILQDLEITYENWLRKLDVINNNVRYAGEPKLSASSAGMCSLKHYFKMQKTPKVPVGMKSLKKMRLGTIVHEDIQTSLEYFFKDYEITCELPVRYKNVKGHLDIVVKIDEETCIVLDIKTMAAYSWSFKYGKNASQDSAKWNKLQLATYALGLMETYNYKTVYMYLWNYNKNTSDMKFESIGPEYVEEAKVYWRDLDANLKTWDNTGFDNMMWLLIQAPNYKWECGYCEYGHICPVKGDKTQGGSNE